MYVRVVALYISYLSTLYILYTSISISVFIYDVYIPRRSVFFKTGFLFAYEQISFGLFWKKTLKFFPSACFGKKHVFSPCTGERQGCYARYFLPIMAHYGPLLPSAQCRRNRSLVGALTYGAVCCVGVARPGRCVWDAPIGNGTTHARGEKRLGASRVWHIEFATTTRHHIPLRMTNQMPL
jgi:hypothetical protein